MKATLIYGSTRFVAVVSNNINKIQLGGYDRPTKLVDEARDVWLCLPEKIGTWGLYPTHQTAWLGLSFIVACHARHEDEAGLEARQQAWEAIPGCQWPALAAKAVEFAAEFRTRLAEGQLCERKLYKSLTRALQDCVLYLEGRETFPEDQDQFLAESAVVSLIEQANRGRAGELTKAEGLALADQVDTLVARLVGEMGGLEVCQQALAELMTDARPGRVILLPEGMSLDRGAELTEYDIVIGTPDEHDIDVVSISTSQGEPALVQLHDILSEQRMDIMAVSPDLGPDDQLTDGHPAFQSVAEMLLANGTPVTSAGRGLVGRLSDRVDPIALAAKYEAVAEDFFSGNHRKSWMSRQSDPAVPQVKKVIPLYRIACDLLPRAGHLWRTRCFSGGMDIAELASEAGLGEVFRSIRSILDRQDASQQELEAIAKQVERALAEVEAARWA